MSSPMEYPWSYSDDCPKPRGWNGPGDKATVTTQQHGHISPSDSDEQGEVEHRNGMR